MVRHSEAEFCPECGSLDFQIMDEGLCKCYSCKSYFPLIEDLPNYEGFERSRKIEEEEEE